MQEGGRESKAQLLLELFCKDEAENCPDEPTGAILFPKILFDR